MERMGGFVGIPSLGADSGIRPPNGSGGSAGLQTGIFRRMQLRQGGKWSADFSPPRRMEPAKPSGLKSALRKKQTGRAAGGLLCRLSRRGDRFFFRGDIVGVSGRGASVALTKRQCHKTGRNGITRMRSADVSSWSERADSWGFRGDSSFQGIMRF